MYILKCFRFGRDVEVAIFTSLSCAVWSFYDYMKTCTNTLGLFYHDMELSLWYKLNKDEIGECLISAYNSSDNKKVIIRDDLLYDHYKNKGNKQGEDELPF